MDMEQALAEKTRSDYEKPRGRKWVAIAGAALAGVLVIGAGVYATVEIRSLNDQLAAYDTQASEDRAVALEQASAAAESAEAAAQSAEAAQAATDSLVAAEEAAAAQAAADEAARVAAEAAAAANSGGTSKPSNGKCPAETAPGQVDSDGTESLCAPTGPGGATCAEYDGPTCTSWLKP